MAWTKINPYSSNIDDMLFSISEINVLNDSKKVITECKGCGSNLKNNKCEYCGNEYE